MRTVLGCWKEGLKCHIICLSNLNIQQSFCLKLFLFVSRKEKSIFWVVFLIVSYAFAVWLIGVNTSDYMDSTTVINLQSSTSSLDNVFYPSVTVCNTNQIRDSFWRAIGITSKTDPRRRLFVSTFFTGSKESLTMKENIEMKTLIDSAQFQKAYCDYFLHTSM